MKRNNIIALLTSSTIISLGVVMTAYLAKPSIMVNAMDPYKVTLDMDGHGEKKTIDVAPGQILLEAIRDNFSDEDFVDGDYYCVGFNDGYAEIVGGIDIFYRQADIMLHNTLTRDIYLYSEWLKLPEYSYDFNATKNKTITKYKGFPEVAKINFSNIPMPSLLINTQYRYFDVDIECSELVNVDNSEDKLDFDIYTSVEKVTNLSINGDNFTIYEPTSNIEKFFYKSFNGDKDYIYLDSIGNTSDYAKLGTAVQDKLVIVNRGSIDFQEKIEAAYNAGAAALLIVNNFPGYLFPSIHNSHDMCVGLIEQEAAQKLIDWGHATEAEGLSYYLGTLNISNKRTDFGVPFQKTSLEFEGKNSTNSLSLFIGLSDSSAMKSGASYKLTISYKTSVYDSKNTLVEEEKLQENKTEIIIDNSKSTPVDPVEPENNKKGGLPAGAIVGIVIGSVVLLGAIGFVLYWFVFRKKKENK